MTEKVLKYEVDMVLLFPVSLSDEPKEQEKRDKAREIKRVKDNIFFIFPL